MPRSLCLCLVLVHAALGAQTPGGPRAPQPSWFDAAMAAAAAGDTAAAIERLRANLENEPDYGPGWLALGRLLAERAGEAAAAFPDRLEARRALGTAVRLMPGDPTALLEYGLLLRKQGIGVDALRVLERAREAAERGGVEFAPEDLARLHYELARVYEGWWEPWQNRAMVPPIAAAAAACSRVHDGASFEVYAVACPREWWAALDGTAWLEELKYEDRQRMLDHFAAVLRVDPGHLDAATRLLGHLVDAGDWAAFDYYARRMRLVAPDDPRSHLFAGLFLHERGRPEEAEQAFEQALALLPPEERARFDDVSDLLPREQRDRVAALDSAGRAEVARIFFMGKDPIFLTPPSERRLEHYARLAWVELKFGSARSELRGHESERGEIYIRYGAPRRRIQEGGRDYWSYGPDGPNFVFTTSVGSRRARLTEPARMLADELAATAPELYRAKTITAVHDVPHQLVRFRGTTPEATRLEVYGAAPLDSLDVDPGDSLQTGFFLFDAAYVPVWDARRLALIGGDEFGLTYLVDVPAGEFRYGIEARRAAPDSVPRPLARARARLTAPGFPAGRLSLSDILVASTIVPRTDAPVRREELAIAPSPTLRFEPGEPVHLYFEAYGLRPDEDGLVRYSAELTVEDSTRRNVVQRALRGAVELLRGGDRETRIRWERTAPLVDGRAVDYLRIELPPLDPGEYAIHIEVTDAASGERAESVRLIRIARASDPPSRPE